MSGEDAYAALSASSSWIATYENDTAISIYSTITDPSHSSAAMTTIRLPDAFAAAEAAPRQLIWFTSEGIKDNDTHLGLVTTNSSTLVTCFTVMDRTRGVVLYTLSCDNTPSIITTSSASTKTTDPSKKKEKNSSAQCIGVLAALSSSHFYIVSLAKNQGGQDRSVVLYECDVATGQVRRKIKLGRYKNTGAISMFSEEEGEWNHNGFAIVPSSTDPSNNKDAIAVALLDGGGHGEYHRLRGVQLSNGQKLYQRLCGSESPISSRRLLLRASAAISVVINKSRGAWELFQTYTGQIIPPCEADSLLDMAIPADRTWQLAVSKNDSVFILSLDERKKELMQIQLVRAASEINATDPVIYESYSIQCIYRIQWSDGDEYGVSDLYPSRSPPKPAESFQRLFLHTNPVDGSVQLVAVQHQDALRVQRIPLAPSNMAALASNGTDDEDDLVELSVTFGNKHPASLSLSPASPVEPAAPMENAEPITAASDSPTTSSRKRKEPPTVLGPGQAGGEAAMKEDSSRSRSATDTKDEEEKSDAPTVGERLQLLRQALEEDSEDEVPKEKVESEERTSFVARHATTESLTQLIAQALQSSDGTMLEQALQVRDPNVLRTTCQSLTAEQVTGLWDAILQRLAQKPNRSEQLVAWVTALLQSNHITHVQHLQPLQNLLAERLEVFPQLIQLEGRLESMVGL